MNALASRPLATVILCYYSLLAAPAFAAPATQCAQIPVEIAASRVTATQEICAAAAAALQFLQQYQLQPKHQLRIELVDEPLHTEGHPIYGSYDYAHDRIEIMSRGAIAERLQSPMMYDQPFDNEHYRGVIAHEIAHAVAHHNTQLERVSTAAQEYLAHATQLAVLTPERRAGIIQAAGVGPWQTDDVISEIYMAFAPDRFAVKCYLHLTQHRAAQAFIQLLLSHQWRYVTVS